MNFELIERHWRVPDQVFIDDVIAVSKKLGKNTVTMHEYLEHGIYHCNTVYSRFGSWFAVLQKAGLKPSKLSINFVGEELLFKNMEDVWTKLGKQPTMLDMSDPLLQLQYSAGTYSYRFGTWMNGLRKFIEYQNSKTPGKGKIQRKRKALREYGTVKNKKVHKTRRHISVALRYSVFLRDGFRCTTCGQSPLTDKRVKLHCDHINPWGKGGETTFDNLQTLCADCNIGKGCKLEKK